MYQSRLGSGFVAFSDGVLETWQPGNEGSGRLHAAVIKSVSILKQSGKLCFMEIDTVYGTGVISFSFPCQDLEIAEKLKELVEEVQADYR